METRKYVSLEGLINYDELIKGKITEDNSYTLASANSYTDTKIEEVRDSITEIGNIDLSGFYSKDEIDNMPFSRIMTDSGAPKVEIYASDGISLTDYICQMPKRGLYVCYVQSGVIDNPPKSVINESSLRGFFYVSIPGPENGNLCYAWVILFDDTGEMYTRYIKGVGSPWANVGIPDNTLALEGTAADAKAVKDYVDNSISEHTHDVENIDGLQTSLDEKVSITRTVNGKSLASDILLSASDVGADSSGSATNALNNAKEYTDEIAKTKSDVGHTHNDVYYTESEIDAKISEVNVSVSNIIDGSTIVAKANHAIDSDNATNSTYAESATQDGNYNIITETYETKEESASKLEEAKSYSDEVASGKANSVKQNATVIGVDKMIEKIGDNQLLFSNGAIFGGTSQDSGIVTSGICGVSTPDENGSCEKDNLFVNFDGTDTYKEDRQLILQASSTGVHYGSNLYQYAAARGDAVKGYVEGISSELQANIDTKADNIMITDEQIYDVCEVSFDIAEEAMF